MRFESPKNAAIVFAFLCAAFSGCSATAEKPQIPHGDGFATPSIQQPIINSDKTYEVKDYGATGDGRTNDTAAISRTIETASSAGGGNVHFPAGKYMVASARIRSNVRLMLDKDAVIEGLKVGYDTPEPNEFDKYQDFGHSHFHNAVLWGENVENFAIIGGKVNGGGAIQGEQKYPTTQPDGSHLWGGDKVIAIKVGRNLLFQNVTHDTGGHFVYLLNDCENITLDGVVIKKSRDAIDLMGCRNVAVTGCNFTGCSDDTLGIKSDWALGRRIKTENIYAWNNYFESGCNGLQFGSETAGDFKGVYIWDVTINKAMKAGIGITSNDGAVIEDVHYKNIRIKNAANPIFMLITKRLRTGETDPKPGIIRNVTIENVVATEVVAGSHHGPANASTISGLPDSYIENITLENVKITYKGGSKKEEAEAVPKYPLKEYSPNGMGVRPASGFYLRHVKGLVFRDVEISFEKDDPKPVVVALDVQGFELDRVKLQRAEGVEVMRMEQVSGLSVRDCPGLKDETVEAEKVSR